MNWLKDIVRPRILTRSKRDVKANVWEKCPGCGDMLYHKDLVENLKICPNCNHHHPIGIDARLNFLLDNGSSEIIEVPKAKIDPLKFKDRKSYSDRLKAAQKSQKSKEIPNSDAFRLVKAKIKGNDCVVCCFDFSFMAGSMGVYVGNAIVKAAETAVADKTPLLIIPASGGARMQEGILSLMQMARTTAAILEVKEVGLPYITLLTNPTTGGVSASFAMQGDIIMAEPGALIGFAGPRVIKQTIGETLPDGFQTAEYLLQHGMVDMIASRYDQPDILANIMGILLNSPDKNF